MVDRFSVGSEVFINQQIWNIWVGILADGEGDVAAGKSWVEATATEPNTQLSDCDYDEIDCKNLDHTIIRQPRALVFDRDEGEDEDD